MSLRGLRARIRKEEGAQMRTARVSSEGSVASVISNRVRGAGSLGLLALLGALIMALVLAPGASAERSVLGGFSLTSPFPPNSSATGTVTGVSPLPLDPNSGLPTAGDLYSSGSITCGTGCDVQTGGTSFYQGGYVRELSPQAEHKRVWGSNVVETGPGNADETQAIRVSATAGTFILSWGGDTTDPIDFDASSSTVEDELNALPSVSAGGGSVSVTGGVGDAGGTAPYIVTFDGGPRADTNQPLIVADGAVLTGSVGVYTTNPGEVGFEICSAEDGDGCRFPMDDGSGQNQSTAGARPGALGASVIGLAINQSTGDIYARGSLRRITHYSATGEFRSAFGMDAVRRGPDDSSNNEVQQFTKAGTSSYTLTLFVANVGTQSTVSLPSDATASQVETALEGLPELSGFGGSVNVIRTGTGTGGDPYVYTITFDGVSGSDSFNQLSVNPTSQGTVTTLQDGGGPEVCTPSDLCKQGAVSNTFNTTGNAQLGAILEGFSGGMTIAPAGAPNEGNLLVGLDSHVAEFDADGEFVGAFGWDVIQSGPNQVAAPDDQQRVTVKKSSGTYRLTFNFQQTGTIAFNAPANDSIAGTPGVIDSVEEALNALPTIGGVGGSVSVTGGPGDASGTNPYVVTFGGAFDDNDVSQMTSNTSTVTVSTLTEGGAFEVCRVDDGDICRNGFRGSQVGQFDSAPISIAENDSGVIYVLENGGFCPNCPHNRRVQIFTPAGGGDYTPSPFGSDETQQLTVNASGGQFRLSVGGNPVGATGTGDITAGSKVITNVNISTGEFKVGQPITSNGFGSTGLNDNTIVTAIGANTITVSAPGVSTKIGSPLQTYLPYRTPDLPFDAPANDSIAGTPGVIDSVEEALNTLPSITTDGSSVTVTGGPGDAGGDNPYEITYSGAIPHANFPDLLTWPGTSPLSGGTGPDAGTATAVTLTEGGPSGRALPGLGTLQEDPPQGISVLPNDDVLIAKSFRAMDTKCANGSPLVFDTGIDRFQEYTPDGSSIVNSSPACNFEPDYIFDEGTVKFVGPGGGIGILPSTGDIYGGFKVWGEAGTEAGLTLNPVSGITNSGAIISGAIDPNGPGPIAHPNPAVTRYAIDFRKAGVSSWTRYVSRVPVGSGNTPVPFSVGLSGLEPKTDYEAKVTAVKPYGFAPQIQTTATFTTLAGVPRIEAPFTENITASSIDLRAAINPSGAGTTYHFEYGKSINYGQSTAAVSIGDGGAAVPVQAHIDGLDPVVYHFRVVASNSEGTSVSPDQTFNFYPEICPNSAARQQAGSTRLPDCRAYELVSPARMGTINLLPDGPRATYASSPPRFAYLGNLGSLPGPWNPPAIIDFPDTYVATRTASGWVSRYIGVQADELNSGDSVIGDQSLDTFLQHSQTTDKTGRSPAPYVFDAQGNQLGRLPTNLAEIPGGDVPLNSGGFVGDQLLSGDGGHFFYSSINVPLLPGGLVSGAGSVYHNDIENGTVEIVSKSESGADILPVPGSKNEGHFLRLPGSSEDGSHLLMAATNSCNSIAGPGAPCPIDPSALYMWVDGIGSYDVSEGEPVNYEGMTADGSKVFFTTDEQMPDTGDTDNSVDLFMWNESNDSLTRVSAAADPVGNTDACNPNAKWIPDCGVEFVDGSKVTGITPGYNGRFTDSAIAADNGTVYFYSPEQLVGTQGFPGHRNLYRYQNGVLSFVASLTAENPATRFQVSPDGRFAAFITRSRLTGYDNTGIGSSCVAVDGFGKPTSPQCPEMYLHDAQTGDLVCASCVPTGGSPSHEVVGSMNGSFLTDDGRAFFATKEALVTRDTDGFRDVYEFVQSRPQLITTGTAFEEQEVGRVGGSNPTGLVGVSANGVDVFIATLETLVEQDENGSFYKFYDARTNGGFPVSAQIQPCAAADECHGTGSSDPQAPRLASGADLSIAGNVRVSRCAAASRSARKLSKRVRALRAKAQRLARSSSSSLSKRRAQMLNEKASRLARGARKTRIRAARCRGSQRRAHANGRAGK